MSSKLQHKLWNHEAEPPANAWEKIEAALDAPAPSFTERLYHFQQQPNSQVWEQIAQQLDAATPATKIIPLKPHSRSLRYIAAAVVLLLATGAFYLFNQDTAILSKQQAVSQPVLKKPKANTKPAKGTAEEPKETLALMSAPQPSGSNPANTIEKHKAKRLVTAKKSSVMHPVENEPVPELAVIPVEKNIISSSPDTDRYMIVTSDVGNAVRLPKKAYSSFVCSDQFEFADYSNCKEKISSLQSKMSASLATDFAGFLDLLKNLQENSK